MGFAWMPEDSRDGSGNGTVDDDTGWPYGRGGGRIRAAIPRQRSPVGHGRVGGRPSAPAGQRTGRHAQSKGRRQVLASLTVAPLHSLSRVRGSRRGNSGTLAGEAEVQDQPARRMAGRGAHAAAWPAMPPR
jgi:hypothetical protein